MAHNPHPAYRPDIDGLRAIAVLSIVAFHASPRNVRGGFTGVDVFFVISGFLIGSIVLGGLARGDFSFIEFYARRIRRIFPALGVVLFATWCLGWFILIPDEFEQLGRHIIGAAFFVVNFIFSQEVSQYFDAAPEAKPLLHLWSLGVEEQFYLVGPLLALIGWRLRSNMLAAITVVAVLSFSLNIFRVDTYPVSTFYLPFTRIWELLLGCGLAEATRRKSMPVMSPNASSVVGGVGLLLIVASAALVNGTWAYPGWWALLPTFGAGCVIAAGPQAWPNKTLLSHRMVVFVGLISYPLYLWHWPLLSLVQSSEGHMPSRITRAAIIGLSFILAILTYLIVERPSRAVRATRGASLFAAGCVSVAVLGLVTLRAGGFAARFPVGARDMAYYTAAYVFATSKLWREGQCYLTRSMTFERFSATCIDTTPKSAPLVFLWGDSHAAALYPGLAELNRQNLVRIAQFTTAACRPSFEIRASSECIKINEFNLRQVASLHPDIVILHANWLNPDFDLAKLDEAIRAIKRTATNIIVVGPAPHWSDRLPKIMIKQFQLGIYPVRLNNGRGTDLIQLEAKLADMARSNGVKFFSVTEQLCNGSSCLTQIGDVSPDLTSFDNAHITPVAANFIAERMLPMLVQAK